MNRLNAFGENTNHIKYKACFCFSFVVWKTFDKLSGHSFLLTYQILQQQMIMCRIFFNFLNNFEIFNFFQHEMHLIMQSRPCQNTVCFNFMSFLLFSVTNLCENSMKMAHRGVSQTCFVLFFSSALLSFTRSLHLHWLYKSNKEQKSVEHWAWFILAGTLGGWVI